METPVLEGEEEEEKEQLLPIPLPLLPLPPPTTSVTRLEPSASPDRSALLSSLPLPLLLARKRVTRSSPGRHRTRPTRSAGA